MNLIIMRHGEAEPYASSDRDRALTDYGRQQAYAAGEWLKANEITINQCWTSPYVRTRQTAESVQSVYGELQTSPVDFLTPGSSPMAVVEQLRNDVEINLLLISHNPMVSQLVNYLSSGRTQGPAIMGTASMAMFDESQWLPGCCSLLWLRHAPNFEQEF